MRWAIPGCVLVVAGACGSTDTRTSAPAPPPTELALPSDVAAVCTRSTAESLAECIASTINYVYQVGSGHRFSGHRYNDRCWTMDKVRLAIEQICKELHTSTSTSRLQVSDDHCDAHSAVSIAFSGEPPALPHIVQVRALPILEPNSDCRFVGLDWASYQLVRSGERIVVRDDTLSLELGNLVGKVIDSY